jgi:Family of unknown function (DUF6011)
MIKTLSAEERAATLAAFDALRTEVETHLAAHQEVFAHLLNTMSPLWAAMVPAPPLTRKPSLGLRLVAADQQLLVGVSPRWNAHTHTVNLRCAVLDVITEVQGYLEREPPTPFYQLDPALSLALQTDAVPRLTRWSRTAPALMPPVVALLTQFRADPAAVLKHSTRFCAICGRHLTDGQSRARGVGPECLKHVSTLVGTRRSIFAAMQAIPE